MTFLKLTFLKCYILSLQDSCVSYPCCQNCASKLHRNQTEQRYRCPKCGFACEIKNVSHRYKLSLKVARDCDIFGLTLFGSCLNPHFGASAVCLQRLVEESKAECSQTDVQQLLTKAVDDCFVGRCFLFGIKMPDFDVDGSTSTSNSFSSSLKRIKISGSFIASRMILPNSAVISCPVVTYFKKLLQAAHLSEFSVSQQPRKLLDTQQHDNSTILNSCECTLASHGGSHSQRTSGTHDDPGYFQQSLGIITFFTERSYSEPNGSAVVDSPKQRTEEQSSTEMPNPFCSCFCSSDTQGKCTRKETLCNCNFAVLKEDGNVSVFLWEDKSFSDVSGEFISKAGRSSEALTENNVCALDKEDAKLTSTIHVCELHVPAVSHNENPSDYSCNSKCDVLSNSKENISKESIDKVKSLIQHSSLTQERNKNELTSMPNAQAEKSVAHLSYWDTFESEYISNVKDYTDKSTNMDDRAKRQTNYFTSNCSIQKEPDCNNFTICDWKCKTEVSQQRSISWLEDVPNFSLDLFTGYEESHVHGGEQSKGESCRNCLFVKHSCNGTLRENPMKMKHNCNSSVSEPDLSNSLEFVPFYQSTPISKNPQFPKTIQYKNKNQVQRDHLLTKFHLKRHYDDCKTQDTDKLLSTPTSDSQNLLPPSMHKIPHLSVHERLMGGIKCACSHENGYTRVHLRNLDGNYQGKSDPAHKKMNKTEAKSNHSHSLSRSEKWDCSETVNVKRSHECTNLKHTPYTADISSFTAENSSMLCNWSADLFAD
ncbi:uncharacterized protein ddias [Paramormyrops kingsleyae]|uniref:DNA damage induced apoptosis suppressor n=1 Tax=Paramormyrops kingsleyae TaxID=1676925 RepID=A0A3B3T282_9TELE|nr:DNA damage-induced apoptosis suppressor protein [Paramormyrops kingsleyae]